MTYMFILKCALKLVPKKYPYISMSMQSMVIQFKSSHMLYAVESQSL